MGTLENQSFKPANQDAMTTRDDKMPGKAPPTGVSGAAGSAAMSGNMIGSGGAGDMRGARMGNRSRAGMGSDRLPSGKLDSPKVP